MAKVSILRSAVVQFEAVPDRPDRNLEIITRLARQAVADGAQLVVFPEMCLLGYWHLRRHTADRLHALAEPTTGPAITQIRSLAMELGAGLGAGWLESDAGNLFNSYAVCLPDGTVHVHRKLHAFEHEAISSGVAFTVFDTPWQVRVGVLICWDNNLVENVRATALLGATVLLAPHQTGGTDSVSPHGMKPIPRGDLGQPLHRSCRGRGSLQRPERARVAAPMVTRTRPRQRPLRALQQRGRPRRQRAAHRQRDGDRPLRPDHRRDAGRRTRP